jgi:Zn-dependent protease
VLKSFSIGQVTGIDIRVHPTLALAVVWVAYQFGVVSTAGLAGAAFGLLLLFLILTCVILHELGHSLMAKEFGLKVRNITLYPMGGAAYIEQMPDRPRAEAAITLAGPLVNVAVAVALLPVVLVVGLIDGMGSLDDYVDAATRLSVLGLALSLLFFNVANVLFNLIPAFPMDGGRLVRAGLTSLLGRQTATLIAVWLGYVVAVAMIGVGLWFREPTLPLIGAFVMYLAYVEGKGIRLQGAMQRLRVGQFALWDNGGIEETVPVTLAVRGGPRDMAVTRDGRVVGMLWRRDVLHAIQNGAGHRPISEVADHRVVPVDIDESIFNVHLAMHATNRWAVPVTEHGVYRGIFTGDRLLHVYRYVDSQRGERRLLANLSQFFQTNLRGTAR